MTSAEVRAKFPPNSQVRAEAGSQITFGSVVDYQARPYWTLIVVRSTAGTVAPFHPARVEKIGGGS